ncbi:MAG: M20 family metallopeptidase [Desulfuromonadales bacterium]
MSINIAAIEQQIDGIIPSIRGIRHHLHANPELALRETGTSRYIRAELAGHGIDPLPPFLKTDVVALLHGSAPGKNVTLRADIDALPILEETGKDYCSTTPGVMHACGHDGHTAMLLGAAIILNSLKNSFEGSVRLVFQPGEEVIAAGRELVEAGALENPSPDAVLALHAWAGKPVGAIGSRPGAMMAAADFFRLTIKGCGGHGSRPEKTIDPILIASRVISRLYEIPSRLVGALDPLVITVCNIHGGSSSNVIPDEAVLEGTVRYFSAELRARVPELIEQAIRAECGYAGAGYNLDYSRPYIPTVNDAGVVALGKEVAGKYLGAASWQAITEPVMGSEDFSYYLERYPGAMFYLGMGEASPQLHNNCFDFNDDALNNGILFLVAMALDILST